MTTQTQTVGKKTSGAGALIAIAVLFIGVTMLMSFILRGVRIDLTESGLYSIAPGTERILTSLKEPINLYFFFSEEASKESPQIRAYAQRVRELLEEMTEESNGKLKLSVIDPQPFSEDEDRAAEYGLQAAPINARNDTMYLGLAATNSTDGREIIPFFQPNKEEFLEYDIASMIYRLDNPEKPTIGLMTTLEVEPAMDENTGQMREGWASIAQLGQLFEVKPVGIDATSIDENIKVLMLIHPKGLSPQTEYAIDQFVMRGGKLIAFLDPQSENDASAAHSGNPMGDRSSKLGKLLDAWGIAYDPNKVVVDRELGLTVALRQGVPPSQHIAILGFNRASMNSKDVITSTLDTINSMTAGSIKLKEGSTLTFQPLIQSITEAALFPTSRVAFLPDSQSLLEGFAPSGERYTVAARIQGKLKSAFPDGAPAQSEGATGKQAESLKESNGDANLIIVADSDLLANPLWLRTQSVFGQRFSVAWANNGDFFANAVDNLAGSSDLISIRGRQSFFRPFTKVDELRRRADERLRETEKELDQELKDTEKKLTELEASRSGQNSLVLSPEQEAEVNRFQQERLRIRKQLRDVRRSLDLEIESLGTKLKFINIAVVPILIAIGAIALAMARRRKLSAGRAAAHTG